MSERVDSRRRGLTRMAACALVAAQFETLRSASAQTTPSKASSLPAVKPGTHSSFTSLKQINAGVLNVGYAEVGPAGGPPVVLLHGWPYDIHSFVDVAPALGSRGYRVIVPYLRGCGTTHFFV